MTRANCRNAPTDRLIPKEIEAILPALYSQVPVHDPVAVVTFFDPYGRFAFYVSQARRDSGGDLLLVLQSARLQ